MRPRRLWAISALDLALFVLGSILMIAEGFDRGVDHVRLRLPDGASADGRIARDTRRFTVTIDGNGPSVDGAPVEPRELSAKALFARDHGADEALVAAGRDVSVSQLVPVLAALRAAGFEVVRIPFLAEKPR